MKKILIMIVLLINFLFSAEVQELKWPKGESFLTFLQKHSIPQTLYFSLEVEDRELCSEINAGNTYYLYNNDDGSLSQVLIPISEDIQLHVYKNSKGKYKFQTLPINYEEFTETAIIPITKSISYDIKKATGSETLAVFLKSIFGKSIDFRSMRKNDRIIIKYSQKVLYDKPWGLPDIKSAMVEIRGKKYFRFKNEKNEKYYDENGKGYSKNYLFIMPLKYRRISSKFTRKRWHPVLKRYRAHLGVDLAAPRGRKIHAASDGRIIYRGRKGGYGNVIIIDHRNGYRTLYAHQKGFKRGLRVGSWVKKGQLIGYVGSTGISTGPHLHLGLYKNGRAVNPLNVIKKPVYNTLKGKAKKTFVACSKKNKKEFLNFLSNNETIAPKKFDRIAYKKDIKLNKINQ